jgi:Toprim domain/CHC2 zinc finger
VRIEEEAARLGLQLKRAAQGEFVGACPRCGGRDRFGINTTKQVFNCRGCGKGGDVIELLQLAAGVEFLEACRALAGERARAPLQSPAPASRPAPAAEDKDVAKGAMALRLWKEAMPIEGTLAETYLRDVRGLELPDDLSDRVLRFHGACWFDRDKYPCLLALWQSIAGDAPRAIMRTALTPDGKKIGRQALGPIAGAAVKLTPDEDVTEGLTIGEGLETVLAGMSEGFKPAWVVGLAGIMKFPVLAGVDALTILVDNDQPDRSGRRAGPAAAAECSQRWTDAGREVRLVVPRAAGADMADVLKQRKAS